MPDLLHIRGASATDEEAAAACEVHDWTLDDWRTRFVPLLRERHGRGGLNCCMNCIERARAKLKEVVESRPRAEPVK
jgi:hypothetical protein